MHEIRTRTSSHRSKPLTIAGATLLVLGPTVAILPLLPVPAVLRVAFGLSLLVIGAVLSAIAPRRGSRFAAVTAILLVLLVLGLIRMGAVLYTTTGAATGPDGYVTAKLGSDSTNFYNGYPDAERPRDPTDANDQVVATLLRSNNRSDQRLVSVTGGRLDVIIWNPKPAGAVLAVVRDALGPLLLVLGIATTLRLLRRVRAGDPFGQGTSRLVRTLGVVMLIGLPLEASLEAIAAEVSLGGSYAFLGQPGDVVSAVPGIATIVPGMLLLIVASAWRIGTDLRELEEGTV